MPQFCLLKDADNYKPLDWDLVKEPTACREWLELFGHVMADILRHAMNRYGQQARPRIKAAADEFNAFLAALRENPAALPSGRLDIIDLDARRDDVLRRHGLDDVFAHIKQRENSSAISLFPSVVARLDGLEGARRWLSIIEGVFAGNIFDQGATATMHIADKGADFHAAAAAIKPRPWFIDDYGRLERELLKPARWKKAVVFVDNAGSDFVLGVMPLLRQLALGGTKIVIAANCLPSLNDITAAECEDVLRQICQVDSVTDNLNQSGMFEVVSSGGDLPVIDLAKISQELNDSAADCDLVMLEGMGRAVETNLDAKFTVDAIRLALVKNHSVARHIGAQMFDCVCKYDSVAPTVPA